MTSCSGIAGEGNIEFVDTLLFKRFLRKEIKKVMNYGKRL